MFTIEDFKNINEQLKPLKELADKELKSIYGLSGMIYTPHIDAYNEVAVQRAKIARELKENKLLAITEVEKISEQLNDLFKRAKNKDIIEYKKCKYQRRFTPLKLSKSGKIVSKWARFWLKLDDEDKVNLEWQTQVKELWPEYFIIRASNM